MSVLAGSVFAQIVAQATTGPEEYGPDPDSVTPGTVGFIITILVVLVAILLANDAFRRVRRVRARDNATDVAPLPIRPDGARSDWKPADANDGTSEGSDDVSEGTQGPEEQPDNPGNSV